MTTDIIELSIFLLFTSGISWLSNRQTESSLKRARESERLLAIERDNLEIKVIERTKELEQSQIEKISEMYKFIEFGKLSTGLIHDLMSPLNALCLDIESGMLTGKQAQSSLYPSIQHLVQSSKKIQNILGATKRRIQVNLKQEVFFIREQVEEILMLHRHRLAKERVQVKISIPSQLHMFGYPSLFGHILTNLISNAADACKAKSPHVPTIEINAVREGGHILLSVKDNGQKIPEDIAAHIFDPFFTTKDKDGCGYGLSASRHIARKYFNGDLQLLARKQNTHGKHDDKNQKKTFLLTLPLEHASDPDTAQVS